MEGAGIIVLILVLVGCSGYIALMIFFPEWVGISGEATKRTLEEHKEESATPKEEDTDALSDKKI